MRRLHSSRSCSTLSAIAAVAISMVVVAGCSTDSSNECVRRASSASAAKGSVHGSLDIKIHWVHDTSLDVIYRDSEDIPFLKRACKTTRSPLKITGDLVGTALMLSDVACWTPGKREGQVYAVLAYDTRLAKTGEAVAMLGYMDLQLDGTASPPAMVGRQTFRDGVGTHHGTLHLEGVVRRNDAGVLVGSGTAKGSIVPNR